MEGCDPGAADRRVLIVGATNRPEVFPLYFCRNPPEPLRCARL